MASRAMIYEMNNRTDEMNNSAVSVEWVTSSTLGEERQNHADKGSEEMEDGRELGASHLFLSIAEIFFNQKDLT